MGPINDIRDFLYNSHLEGVKMEQASVQGNENTERQSLLCCSI